VLGLPSRCSAPKCEAVAAFQQKPQVCSNCDHDR